MSQTGDAADRFGGVQPLVEIRDLVKHYKLRRRWWRGEPTKYVKAVDGVSLGIGSHETYGLVGESGCGKTTLGRLVLRLEKPTSGDIVFEGASWLAKSGGDLRSARQNVQAIFQDPLSALDPRRTIRQSIIEAFEAHPIDETKQQRQARATELLERVGLNADLGRRYPHEISGGQRQRVTIARAMAVNPKFIVADEAVSALDVSVQAQIINLLADLRESLQVSYLFISHGLATVRHIADEVGVMYLGKLVEQAPAERLFSQPAHPYTTALLAAAPTPDPARADIRPALFGEVPSATNLPSGCRFRTRCPRAEAICAEIEPPLVQTAEGHWTACHFADLSSAGSRTHSVRAIEGDEAGQTAGTASTEAAPSRSASSG